MVCENRDGPPIWRAVGRSRSSPAQPWCGRKRGPSAPRRIAADLASAQVNAPCAPSSVLDLASFLVGLGGGQGEHAEPLGIDGLAGRGIAVGRIVGGRLAQRHAGGARARAAIGARFSAGVPCAAGQRAAVTAIGDHGDDDALAGGPAEEDARDLLIADVGDVAQFVGRHHRLIFLLLFGAARFFTWLPWPE